jgi:hypothetical protein
LTVPDHELSKACASYIHDIFQAADAQYRNQISAAQPCQVFDFLMPGERIDNMALQFEWRSRQHSGNNRQDDQDNLL